MPLGIIDVPGVVPGTAFLEAITGGNDDSLRTEGLKRGTGRAKDIILVPQPSRDPKDPFQTDGGPASGSFAVSSPPNSSSHFFAFPNLPRKDFSRGAPALVVFGEGFSSRAASQAVEILPQSSGLVRRVRLQLCGYVPCYHFRRELDNICDKVPHQLAPYDFNARETGLTSAGPLVGSLFGTAVAGPLVDYIARWFARRNSGIYEPEARLIPTAAALFFMVGGLGAWAGMTPAKVHWSGPVIIYGVVNFGQLIAAASVTAYLLDVHKKNSTETFGILSAGKDLLLWGLSRQVCTWLLQTRSRLTVSPSQFNGWIVADGVVTIFSIVAGATAFCLLLSAPMYIFGKKVRNWMAENPVIFGTN
ncbi:hypothetical protein P7C70_g2217, partial [Phenoliferia sp. Uapishka_3]